MTRSFELVTSNGTFRSGEMSSRGVSSRLVRLISSRSSWRGVHTQRHGIRVSECVNATMAKGIEEGDME